MYVLLTPQLETIIREKMASGRFRSESEVIAEALRLLDESDRGSENQFQELKRDIEVGLGEISRGEVEPLDIEGIKARGRKILENRHLEANG